MCRCCLVSLTNRSKLGTAIGAVRSYLSSVTELCQDMFCRVCGFRVRIWPSYRTCGSSGHGNGSLAELTEVPGTGVQHGLQVLQNSQKFQVGTRMLYPYPGYCGTGVQNLQKFLAG